MDSHFLDFVEDQFDFHQYCLRKQTMRVYVDMLRMEDGLYKHPVYAKAVEGAVATYLELHDNPGKSPEEVEAEKVAAMTPEEAKKYLQKKRKEDAKKLKETESANATSAAAAAAGGGKGADSKKPQDPDPNGVQLAATKDPLGEATKLLNRLLTAAPDRLETQLMAFEIFSRKKKVLLALRAVKKAAALADGGKEHPQVHYALVRLAVLIQKEQEDGSANAVVDSVFKEQISELLGSTNTTAAAYHAAWAQQHGSTSLAHRFTAAQATVALDSTKKADAAAELAKAGPSGASHPECVQVHQWLEKCGEDAGTDNGSGAAAAATEFSAACAKVFKWSRYFGGEKCVPLPEKENSNGDAAAKGVEKLKV